MLVEKLFVVSAIGDALGVPFEFIERGNITLKQELPLRYSSGVHAQKPGTWSDDTGLTLATADSLARCGGFNKNDMWDAFYDWLNKPYVYKPDAYIFDSGNATRAAINYQANWIGTFNHLDAGGNGALMRILPAILFYQDHEPSVALRSIVEIAEMTHGHPESTACCLALHYFYQMNRLGKYEIALGMIRKNWPERNFSEPPNLCTGFVTDTLHAAIWSIETSMTLEEALVNTIMLGGDTDTNAQVTAQLWAIKTEFKQGFILPDYLLEGLRGKDTIMPIVQRFQAAIAK